MGLLTSLISQRDTSPSSDYWYTPIGAMTRAGEQITEDRLLQISSALQGIRFWSQTLAALPKPIYRHLPDGKSREKDRRHYLNRLLKYQPNPWQTAFQFFEMMTARAMLSGFALAQKIYGRGGREDQIDALIPLDSTRLIKVEQRSNYKLRFLYRSENGRPRNILQEEAFFLPWFGAKGFLGLALAQQMRETAGLELAVEAYGGDFFSNFAMPRVVLSSPKAVSQPARDRIGADWNRAYSGEKKHGVAFLEEDTKVEQLSTKNDEAQFVETRRFLIPEFSRFLDVAPHHLYDMEKSSYNNMEQMSLETVIYGLVPIVERWEQCCYRDLLSEEDKDAGRFIEFSIDGLLRGDTKSRSQFYKDGIYAGWLTRNEVREKENHNPIEGLDDPLQPQNYIPVGEGAEAQTQPPATKPLQLQEGRVVAIAQAAAERVVSRETQKILKWKERKNGDGPAWRDQVEAFYEEHAEFVARAMAIEPERARRYCELQCAVALRHGLDAIDATEQWFAENAVASLVAEALK